MVMTIIARGRKQVERFERALGGEPRRSTVKKAQSELTRWLKQRAKERSTVRDEIELVFKRQRELILQQTPNSDLGKATAKLKRLCQQRASRKIARPVARLRKIEPRIVSGSNFAIHTPPYDADFTYNPNNRTADASKSDGSYNVGGLTLGQGSMEMAAGLASNFFCVEAATYIPGDPSHAGQRFAAAIEYYDDWFDVADFYVAHNDMQTWLWVWGESENTWVAKAPVQPSWSDGASWLDSHGNDPAGDGGVISVETNFSVRANSWYQGWVWSDALIYGQGGFLGFGASQVRLSATVPLMVFGSL
jgi:hypothetical protein